MRAPYENSPPLPSMVSHLMPRSDSSACSCFAERADQIERQQVAAPAAKHDAPPGAAAAADDFDQRAHACASAPVGCWRGRAPPDRSTARRTQSRGRRRPSPCRRSSSSARSTACARPAPAAPTDRPASAPRTAGSSCCAAVHIAFVSAASRGPTITICSPSGDRGRERRRHERHRAALLLEPAAERRDRLRRAIGVARARP